MASLTTSLRVDQEIALKVFNSNIAFLSRLVEVELLLLPVRILARFGVAIGQWIKGYGIQFVELAMVIDAEFASMWPGISAVADTT